MFSYVYACVCVCVCLEKHILMFPVHDFKFCIIKTYFELIVKNKYISSSMCIGFYPYTLYFKCALISYFCGIYENLRDFIGGKKAKF